MYIQFKYNNGNYALQANKVKELINFSNIKLIQTPNSSEHILGLVSYRNEIIQVIDFPTLLKIGKTDLKKERLILLVLKNNVGFLIEDNVETFPELIKKTENLKLNSCADIGYNYKNDIVCNLNLEKLFNV